MAARTVNDYSGARALRQALQPVDEERSMSVETMSDHDLAGGSSHHDDFNHDEGRSKTVLDVNWKAVEEETEKLDENWDWVLKNYDVGTTNPQSITQELHRLQVLKSYAILDEDREDAFDRLTAMASRTFGVPIAVVSLVDIGRQWFMSNHGLGDVRETPRNLAFCAHAIQGKNDIFEVKDTFEDSRFRDHGLVTGAPYIRFYAGAPLLSPEGYKLGTFCIIDSEPHPDGLSPDESDNLIDFAAMAMDAMVKRRQITAQDNTGHLLACTAHDLLTPLMGVQLSLSLIQEDAKQLSETHQESLSNAIRSSDWLQRICQTTMDTLRNVGSDDEAAKATRQCPLLNLNGAYTHHLATTGELPPCTCGSGNGAARDGGDDFAGNPFIDMKEFFQSLNDTMESIPKQVPLIMTSDDSVPRSIVSDELKIFRSSLNLLENAFSNTTVGSVKFHVRATSEALVFECTDTGKDLEMNKAESDCLFKPCKASTGVTQQNLGLYSVGYQIHSLGGSCGYRPRADEGRRGSVFWFSVPLVIPEDVSVAVSMAPSISDLSGFGLDLMDTLEPSVVHHSAVNFPLRNESRRESLASGSLQDSKSVVRSAGLFAVAAASLKTPSTSISCCGLDELAKYDNIEAYKACQLQQAVQKRVDSISIASNSTSKSALAMRRTGSLDNDIRKSAIRKAGKKAGMHRSRSLDYEPGTVLRPQLVPPRGTIQLAPAPPVSNITIVMDAEEDNNVPLPHDGEANMAGLQNSSPSIDSENNPAEVSTQSSAAENLLKTEDSVLRKPPVEPPISVKLIAERKAPYLRKEVSFEGKQKDVGTEPADKQRQKKALVIEDTLIVRKTLTRALQKRGYEVAQAVDGVEGLNALKKAVFDITLCDFLMPNMDGLDCVQQYRQWERGNRAFKQRIVGISAHVSHKDIDKGLEVGMDDFRPKPITIKTLQELDECPEMDRIRDLLSKMSAPELSRQKSNPSSLPQKCKKSCLMATARVGAEECETAKNMTNTGWQVTIVNSGTRALEHLKLRNWDAVILDDDLPSLPGNACVEEFRSWEGKNRVNRQDNLFIVCTDVLLQNPKTKMLPPAGFDGAVDSQVSWEQIQSMMNEQTCQSTDGLRAGLSIVTR